MGILKAILRATDAPIPLYPCEIECLLSDRYKTIDGRIARQILEDSGSSYEDEHWENWNNEWGYYS